MNKIILVLFLFSFFSCSKGSEEESTLAPPPASAESSNSSISIDSSLPPANGTYGENGELIFQLNYSGIVLVTGSPTLSLNIGGTSVQATYQSGSGTSSIEFHFTISAGLVDNDGISLIGASINLNGGSLEDADNKNIDTNLGSHFSNLIGVQVNTSQLAPGQVMNLTTAPTTNDTTVSLSWGVPNNNGTPITHYIVQYKEAGTSIWQQYNPSPSVNSLTVNGLEAGTTYDFRVAASNGVLGPYSNPASFASFNILDLNPIAWLDATDLNGDGSSTPDDTKIQAWVDKSGTATDATENDVNKQPVLKHNIINGLPAVYFNNLDRGLQGTFNRAINAGLTIFVVGFFESSQSDKCIFEFYQGSARAFFIDRRYAGNTTFSPNLTKGSFKQWRVEDSGTISSVYENGSPILTNSVNTFNTSFTGTGNYVLGDDSTGGNRMVGYIAEFLIFDGVLTAGDSLVVEDYLNQKWGL